MSDEIIFKCSQCKMDFQSFPDAFVELYSSKDIEAKNRDAKSLTAICVCKNCQKDIYGKIYET